MPKLTKEQREQLVKEYVAGETTPVLAKKYGVFITSIHGLLHRRGIKPRSYSEAFRRCVVDHDAFSNAESNKEAAYWIGFIMADGFIQNDNLLSMSVNERDHGHVEKLKAFLKTDYAITKSSKKYYTGATSTFSRLTVRSEKIVSDLERYGVIPRKSHTAKVKLLHNSIDFWRGIIDGDGCLTWGGCKAYSRVYIRCQVVGSELMMQDFLTFCKQFAPTCKATVRKTKTVYVVGIQGSYALKIISELYSNANCFLSRKKAIADYALLHCNDSGALTDHPGELNWS